MGSVKAGKFQTAIFGFFGCKWILLGVIFALLSQNKLLGGKYVLVLLVGLVLTKGIDVQENRPTASKENPPKILLSHLILKLETRNLEIRILIVRSIFPSVVLAFFQI